jgi:hypothetical protein
MATVGENGKIQGGVVRYHAERALEAVRWAEKLPAHALDGPAVGAMVDDLAYDHARAAAGAARRGRNSNLAWKRRRARS